MCQAVSSVIMYFFVLDIIFGGSVLGPFPHWLPIIVVGSLAIAAQSLHRPLVPRSLALAMVSILYVSVRLLEIPA